jgi:hypothetical protein
MARRENVTHDADYYSRKHTYYRHPILIHTYDVVAKLTPETCEPFEIDWEDVDRTKAAELIRLGRKHGAEMVITHRTEFRVQWLTYCAGCLARPSEWEWDCDGQYDTVNCGVCDWHAAFDTRIADRDRSRGWE